jgi:hypothetical protein
VLLLIYIIVLFSSSRNFYAFFLFIRGLAKITFFSFLICLHYPNVNALWEIKLHHGRVKRWGGEVNSRPDHVVESSL